MYVKKYFTSLVFLLLTFNCFSSSSPYDTIKPRLGHLFGIILKLKVEVYDGAMMNDKYHQSGFLFKVIEINDNAVTETHIMEFKDETGKFPNDEFGLYKIIYGKEAGTIDEETSKKIKKQYVGLKFIVMAYETGEFRGKPEGYFKYRPVVQDLGYHFNNYLIVVDGTGKGK